MMNIEFHQGGFLTYKHHAEPVDMIVSQFALHHLPDFWKLIGLHRLVNRLKGGGKLYLKDVVYSFEYTDYERFFNKLISDEEKINSIFAKEFEISIQKEYTTLDWIMEGILVRAGLTIIKADYCEGFLAHYLCEKKLG